jgi:hypothetical protein
MRKKSRLLVGVAALVMPMATVALLSQPAAVAKKPPPNPVSCTGLSATIQFSSPGLSFAGQTESTKTPTTVSVVPGPAGTCTGGTAPNTGGPVTFGNITISVKPTPIKHSKPKAYSYDTCSSFTSAASKLKKEIKVINFTIGGSPVQFKTKSTNILTVPEVGFQLNGQVKSGNYSDKTAQLNVFVSTDTGSGTTGNFGNDIVTCSSSGTPAMTIATAQVDPSNSNGTL